MSPRRLATSQPESFSLSSEAEESIKTWIGKYPGGRQHSALIPALWIAQNDNNGWLPEAALRVIGDMLGVAYIRVYEVATFYTMFNLAPVGEHHIQLCGTTPCWLRGADDLKNVLRDRIGPGGSVSGDGRFSWTEVECLGACANAPMVQISNRHGHDYYEDLTPDNLTHLIDNLAAGKPVRPGPQNDRYSSEPEGGNIALQGKGYFHTEKLETLPNCEKKVSLNYYEPDPKERRATRDGWVDPGRKASADPKRRKSGGDISAGLSDQPLNAARPARANKARPKNIFSHKPRATYTDGATGGVPDDLKRIKGVGSKFEDNLNALGICYFRQIAAWTTADIKQFEEIIGRGFAGRVARDEWVKQARKLADES